MKQSLADAIQEAKELSINSKSGISYYVLDKKGKHACCYSEIYLARDLIKYSGYKPVLAFVNGKEFNLSGTDYLDFLAFAEAYYLSNTLKCSEEEARELLANDKAKLVIDGEVYSVLQEPTFNNDINLIVYRNGSIYRTHQFY